MGLDYRYLKAFLSTAEHMSFSKAAQELKIAQSAVSRQIKLLEENVGEELIVRSSKKVLLTHKGQELYRLARYFDHRSKDLFEKEDARALKVGLLHGLLKNWFPPILTKYCKKSTRDVHLFVKDEPELLRDVEAGNVDVIFTTKNIQSDLVTSLKIFDEKLVLVSKDQIKRDQIHKHPWIVFSEADNIFKLEGEKGHRIISVESMTTILTLVKNGLGISVVPEHVLPKSHPYHLLELPELPKSEISMTTLNYKTMPPAIAELSSIIRS